MKKCIQKYKTCYQDLPQIHKWKKLWHQGYWDGALSGVCEVNGEKCWFELLEEWSDNNSYSPEDSPEYEDFEPPWFRRFLVFKLSEEQYSELLRRHQKFERTR